MSRAECAISLIVCQCIQLVSHSCCHCLGWAIHGKATERSMYVTNGSPISLAQLVIVGCKWPWLLYKLNAYAATHGTDVFIGHIRQWRLVDDVLRPRFPLAHANLFVDIRAGQTWLDYGGDGGVGGRGCRHTLVS
ncbi:hypothetical protein V2G26_012061 [Clonostachys chloroleuca]